MSVLLILCYGMSVYLTVRASSTIATIPERARKRRPTLFVEPMNGLSNRIRAIASARALARASSRRLVIVWKQDVQCNISLTRLIEVEEPIIDSFSMSLDTSLRYYSNARDVVRLTNASHDVYIRTPFVLSSDVHYEHLIAREFRAMRPVAHISKMVNAMEQKVSGSHELAVHIRMLSNYSEDVPGVSDGLVREFVAHTTTFRDRCHWRHFLDPLEYIDVSHRAFTIDSDVPEATRRIRSAFPSGIVLDETCVGVERRWGRCVEIAFAHILFMARSPILLLSHWSSFSELVQWFAPRHSIAVNGCEYVPRMRTWVTKSVVVACRNRETVYSVVQNALRVADNTTEVVVVDWSSKRRIARRHSDPRVRVIRVEDTAQWNIAQAYNVGFRHVSGEFVLKIDCDTRLSCMPPPVSRTTFYTGDWRHGGHLNGIVYAPRRAIQTVGGYDERLDRYGWDDDDLYNRLQQLPGMKRHELDMKCVHHIPHGNRERGVLGVIQGLAMTQMNRLCIGGDLWNASHRASSYRTMFSEPSRLLQVWKPKPIQVTSQTCDDRLANSIVLFGLFSECTAPNCKDHFWRVSRESWETSREFMMRLVPTHIDVAIACEKKWPAFVRPVTVESCASALKYFDAYVRAYYIAP